MELPFTIIIEIQQGKADAFEQVYHRYHEKMYSFIVKHTASPDMAEEVVQQAFIKLWETRERLSLDFSIATQLARITRTTLIDILRKKAVERKAHRYIATRQEIASQTDPLLEKELAKKLSSVIEKLPPVCRTVFRLSREEGLSHKEISRQLSISTKSVEKHITRALKIVREVIALLAPLLFFLKNR